MANIAVWKVYLNGDVKILPLEQQPAPGTLDASSALLPGGAYTTFRTFGGDRVLHLGDHLHRLEETARLAGHAVLVSEPEVRKALRLAMAEYPAKEKRVRLTLDLEQKPGSIYIQVEPLQVPSEQDYRDGVAAVTVRAHRINPKAKLTNFIARAGEVRQTLPAGINEALMVDEASGRILEGLSSNFFAVWNGEIWTAEEGVLSGITRSLALEEARAEGYAVRLEGILKTDLDKIDEAFITSSSRDVLPVVKVNGRPVGSGRPGPVSRRLLERYRARIQKEAEPV